MKPKPPLVDALRVRLDKAEAEVADLTAERARLQAVLDAARDVLTAIRDYPGPTCCDEDGYPIEVVCDEYAYRRIVDSYRRAARQGLEAMEAADLEHGRSRRPGPRRGRGAP
jgi:hypothetical protein